ncbi:MULTISPECIES: NADH:flavin oxidoreductase [Psychrilyobacter]|uniref:NADH:flavin oxidoreductase n=1 Tax=Psychrilyobacter piezotolerans TaxID=2293438 RepID=A0ABX9KF74_9FUSO|nr:MULTISPECIES: NADH:flavin oxidoreductase [Psychrilyobacter]MCS5422567.1 NADH:flavin oxidoreductase [Psychrilyobacter sp. S5]NDI78687.1 NADH:flavin oxidoreductase [Psychrilyobacter piezotolerans]RDE59864.1 NADH:flavin oxidoreductase [Psychrilyobacter sp. S5]REI40145.1 NADH:flavin oxidoreductase [Psychrilyobacter piezotolerans]
MKNLFSEINIKGKKIKNRVVVPPMLSSLLPAEANKEGKISERRLYKHYKKIAEGGAGLIILEGHSVNRNSRIADTHLGIWSDEHIEGLKKIADICHENGAKVILQIMYPGFKTDPSMAKLSVAPSEYIQDGNVLAREITKQEIYEIQGDFLKAAKRAQLAGLDGIELHGAHGFLLSQFASPTVNKRKDEYGGGISNRMRFACEIIELLKNELNNDFIIGYRMGANEPTINEGIDIAKILDKKGIDYIHVSAGFNEENLPKVPDKFPCNAIVFSGTEIKKYVSIPVIVVNEIKTPEQAKYLIEKNMADFVAVGRAHVADYNWTNKVKENKKPISCLSCKTGCMNIFAKCPRHL